MIVAQGHRTRSQSIIKSVFLTAWQVEWETETSFLQ